VDSSSRHEALRRSFAAARAILHRVQWIAGAAMLLVLVGLAIRLEWTFLLYGGDLLLGGALFGAAVIGTSLGVKVGARRARRAVRQLPEAEAVRLLKRLAEGPGGCDRLLAEEMMKGLRPGGTEVIASEAPAGRGTELAGGGAA
jgi:hypothetical protein